MNKQTQPPDWKTYDVGNNLWEEYQCLWKLYPYCMAQWKVKHSLPPKRTLPRINFKYKLSDNSEIELVDRISKKRAVNVNLPQYHLAACLDLTNDIGPQLKEIGLEAKELKKNLALRSSRQRIFNPKITVRRFRLIHGFAQGVNPYDIGEVLFPECDPPNYPSVVNRDFKAGLKVLQSLAPTIEYSNRYF